ncbi:serine/threonine-protein kinase ATR, partial [Paragonimus westermani]
TARPCNGNIHATEFDWPPFHLESQAANSVSREGPSPEDETRSTVTNPLVNDFTSLRQHTSEWSHILSRLRLEQLTELNAAALEGPGGYARAYETIARLSALSEVELISSLGELFRSQYSAAQSTRPTAASEALSTSDSTLHSHSNLDLRSQLENVLSLLDSRLKMYQPTFHTLEPCLAMHHTSLHLLWLELRSLASVSPHDPNIRNSVDRLRLAIGQNWLDRAKLTRKCGQFMAAYTCVLRAEAFGIPQALVERAKLLWQTDKRESAQACLEKGIPELYGTRQLDDSNTLLELDISHQQAQLLRVRYCEETSRFDFETTQRMYEEVCGLRDGCEEAHFRLARYVERACSLATVTVQHDTLLKAALTHYGLALSYGSQFIYQSMPRLLCLWLDYGTDFARRAGAVGPSAKNATTTSEARLPPDEKTFQEVQEIMRRNIQQIPAYQYYTALGQLLSRVCHEVPTIVSTLIDLVVRIFEAYPLQTIWFLMPLNDSTVRQRRERCQQIFSLVNNFSQILIPTHQQLVPNLLPSRARHEDVQRHWPFGSGPDQLVCLARMDDTVEILGSQTKPKKMTWIGSDGRRYIIVAKPNDDLRKDSRLMELNGMINKFLAKNPDTRRRALQIRTYAVIPLSENGGLIEWVSNTEPFRTIITKLYSESGRPINWAAMSRVAPLLDDPLPYSARECYARTSAVMSMVGYVLGLGDRHTENILFDSTTGGVVHVDFSCVFNNGLTLPWPERVPFRLTRNMVHALGPTGYEGIFRRCSEAVMRLLRREIDPLLAVFRPIYFDALVEQDSNTRGLPADSLSHISKTRRVNGAAMSDVSHDLTERVARAATEKLTGMEDRLHGKITEHDGFSQILPMSAEGQGVYILPANNRATSETSTEPHLRREQQGSLIPIIVLKIRVSQQ